MALLTFLLSPLSSPSLSRANLVLQAKQKCPHTKIILSGYSQGGQLVHNAARILGPLGMISAVSATVTFGDPCAFSLPQPQTSNASHTLTV